MTFNTINDFFWLNFSYFTLKLQIIQFKIKNFSGTMVLPNRFKTASLHLHVQNFKSNH